MSFFREICTKTEFFWQTFFFLYFTWSVFGMLYIDCMSKHDLHVFALSSIILLSFKALNVTIIVGLRLTSISSGRYTNWNYWKNCGQASFYQQLKILLIFFNFARDFLNITGIYICGYNCWLRLWEIKFYAKYAKIYSHMMCVSKWPPNYQPSGKSEFPLFQCLIFLNFEFSRLLTERADPTASLATVTPANAKLPHLWAYPQNFSQPPRFTPRKAGRPQPRPHRPVMVIKSITRIWAGRTRNIIMCIITTRTMADTLRLREADITAGARITRTNRIIRSRSLLMGQLGNN